jgi:hypothetical protein
MPNALDTPPIPLPANGASSAGPSSQPMNALAMGGGAGPQGGSGPGTSSPLAALAGTANASSRPQQPAPTHAQAVAALRHFAAIQGVLSSIMRDPALGKSDLKSKIIDGVTSLVAERIMSPATAVSQLADVPSEPFKQKQWLQQHLETSIVASNAVLDHHRAAHAGVPDSQIDMKSGGADSHMDDMKAMMAQHYQPSDTVH